MPEVGNLDARKPVTGTLAAETGTPAAVGSSAAQMMSRIYAGSCRRDMIPERPTRKIWKEYAWRKYEESVLYQC